VYAPIRSSRLGRLYRRYSNKGCYSEIKFLSLDMIEELLEKRRDLFEIAALLYGDEFVMCKDFWGSPTEKHLQEVYQQLHDLGYEFPAPTDEQIDQARKIAEDLDLGLDFEE
jgi:hypothetical protein